MIEFTDKGLFCRAGGFYIDPWRPVDKAIITHAHSDHASQGHKSYLTHHINKPLLDLRLGMGLCVQTLDYNQSVMVNGIKVSLHPAGHVPGSAQIRLEHKGEIWVASGDYKLEDDGVSTPFEPVGCHTFISESTFGLPIYKWQSQAELAAQINQWWQTNQAEGKCSVLFAYSLGKAQRLISLLDQQIGPIFAHGAIINTNEALTKAGLILPKTPKTEASLDKSVYRKAMILAPPSAQGTAWMRKFEPYSTGIASGWMNLRGAKRRRAADAGFVVSDHADWDGLNLAISQTGAQRVYVTHGYTTEFAKWLNEERGIEAHAVLTRFSGNQAVAVSQTEQTVGETLDGE